MVAAAAFLGAAAAPAKTYEVKSPDGRLSIVLTAGDRLAFSVARDGATLVAPSEMALTLSTGEVLGEAPAVRSARRRSVGETIEAPFHRQSRFDAAYNELDLRLRGSYGVIARAYDEGVCYRFYTERDGELTIVDETARLNFEGDPAAYVPYTHSKDPFQTSFESTYTYAPLSEFRKEPLAFMPLLVDLGERGYVLYSESDVEAYPGIFLTYDAAARGLKACFAGIPSATRNTKRFEDVVTARTDRIACVDGRRSYPWRIVGYAATAAELPLNDMVYATAAPSRVADVSWIRDGKVAWDWWNDWGVYGVDFETGINTATYKYFIDFAAARGIEYVVLDEGWGVRDGNVMHVIPEIDLPEIVSYARKKKVDIILWVVAKVLDDRLEEACRHYSQMGVAGWKVDFIDRQDQPAVERVYRIADAAARYKMVVDFHGVYKPTGLQRTYPNVINFEERFLPAKHCCNEQCKDFSDVAGKQECNAFENIIIDPAAFLHSGYHRCKVIVRQNNVCRLFGYLGAYDAHGTANIRIFQRRRVIDAIPCHGGNVSLRLPSFYDAHLMFRRNTGVYRNVFHPLFQFYVAELIQLLPCQSFFALCQNAQALCNGHSCRLVVSCDHNRLDPCLTTGFYCFFRFLARRVYHARHTHEDQLLL